MELAKKHNGMGEATALVAILPEPSLVLLISVPANATLEERWRMRSLIPPELL